MTADDIKKWLEERRTAKDFPAIKDIRDKCRALLAVRNTEWFSQRNQDNTDH